MVENVLEVKRLSKRFGKIVAVKDISLEVRAGEIFGVLGPNGAGKTTTIGVICGLLSADSGEIFIHGKRVQAGNGIYQKVGVCPQEIILWERLTCFEQLLFIGEMYGVPGRVARQRAERLLAEMGLEEKRNTEARSLSGGMQRRLNLIMALVHDPEILILDEPEAGLDPQSKVKVRQYIQSLARKKTVLLTTHNMDEADRVADRIAVLDHGEVLRVGTPEELKNTIGQGDVLEIRISGEPAQKARASQAIAELDASGKLLVEEDMLIFRALRIEMLLPSILDILRANAVQTRELKIRENSLEDVFLELTGRRMRE